MAKPLLKRVIDDSPVETFPILLGAASELRFGLDHHIADLLAQAQPASGKPYLLHMLGVPGSGKSTIITALYEQLAARSDPPPFLLDFDLIMTAMPAYQEALNNRAAFSVFELPARKAGYHLLQALLEKKVNILFDHGGSPKTHPDILDYARHQQGYETFVAEVICDEETAKNRIHHRNAIQHRHTPVRYVEERSTAIQNLKPAYHEQADHYIEIENHGSVALAELERTQIKQLAEQLLDI